MSNIRQDSIKSLDMLTTHSGRIKERLIAAGKTGIVGYDDSRIPLDLREDYNDLVKKLTQSRNAHGDGFIEQTINGMSEDEAVRIAEHMQVFIRKLLDTSIDEFDYL